MRLVPRLFILLSSCVVAPTYATSQPPGAMSTPAPGSPQRRAILDTLRPVIERRLGSDIEFVVREIRVVDDWAFVAAMPQRRGGAQIDGRRYFREFEFMGGLEVTALLRVRGARWRVVEHAIGATDVWFCDRGPSGLTPRCDAN